MAGNSHPATARRMAQPSLHNTEDGGSRGRLGSGAAMYRLVRQLGLRQLAIEEAAPLALAMILEELGKPPPPRVPSRMRRRASASDRALRSAIWPTCGRGRV